MTRIDGTSFVLAGIHLTRFIRSPAGREAGILVEPATAHRLVAVALFIGAKFGGHPPSKWIGVFEASSAGAICRRDVGPRGPLPACNRLSPVRGDREVLPCA
jgi:hypothetical protein